MEVVRLSVLDTVRLYSTGKTPGHSAAGRINLMKNPSDAIVNRTRDLLACSAVHKAAVILRARSLLQINVTLFSHSYTLRQTYGSNREKFGNTRARAIRWYRL
jgi:hypothetical protein